MRCADTWRLVQDFLAGEQWGPAAASLGKTGWDGVVFGLKGRQEARTIVLCISLHRSSLSRGLRRSRVFAERET